MEKITDAKQLYDLPTGVRLIYKDKLDKEYKFEHVPPQLIEEDLAESRIIHLHTVPKATVYPDLDFVFLVADEFGSVHTPLNIDGIVLSGQWYIE